VRGRFQKRNGYSQENHISLQGGKRITSLLNEGDGDRRGSQQASKEGGKENNLVWGKNPVQANLRVKKSPSEKEA